MSISSTGRLRRLLLGSACGILAAGSAAAEVTLVDQDGTSITADLVAGAGIFHNTDTYFGNAAARPPGVEDDATWQEFFVVPGLNLNFSAGASSIYGRASAAGVYTGGDGEPLGFDSRGDVDLEEAYLGWNSGDTFDGFSLDLSAGSQPYVIGDAFIIGDGDFDWDDDGGYWMNARKAFDMTGIARLNVGPALVEGFYLETDSDYGTKLTGINAELSNDMGVIGASYMKVHDVNNTPLAPPTRDGMSVVSVRAQGNPVDNVFLAGEVALQDNSSPDLDAHAWYAEAGYTFAEAPWSPTIGYRYSSFSGDDAATAESEAYDPLFYGMERGWGTWFQGEIMGEYYWMNSNMNAHMFKLSGTPLENVEVGALLFRMDFEETSSLGVTDDHLADEINLYADWGVNDWLWLSAVYGYVNPGDGGEQLFGGDDPMHMFQLVAITFF